MNKPINLSKEEISARSRGESYQEILDKEPNPVPGSLRESTETYLGSENLSVDRYLSREYYDLEVEKMWSKTWQMACRESEVAAPGDYFVYDIAHYSIVITRNSQGELKAYRNACLHRGRQLRQGSGTATEFKCPYHGFRWNLDGEFAGAPCEWDFPHIDKPNFKLPQVKLDTWGGWIFINLDQNAGPLGDYLGILPEHFKRWKPENTFKLLHIEKVIECNWKVCWEAFIESYHTVQTHPQIMPYLGDSNSQYDCWGDNISRTISPMGVVSPHLENIPPDQTVNDWLGHALQLEEGQRYEVPEGMSPREWLADYYYKAYNEHHNGELSEMGTQAEVLDSILYSVFPNFAPWAGFSPHLTYRMKPYGDNHEMCTMEIFMFMHFPEGTERPADCAVQRLDKDQLFSEAEGMEGGLGRVFDQDFSNLKMVQKGLKNVQSGEVVLANYQEVRIRHFHQTMDKYLNA